MSAGSALYSGTSRRGLYSGTSGRALYNPRISFGTPSYFWNQVSYTVQVDSAADQIRSVVYPDGYTNAEYSWSYVPGYGQTRGSKSYWTKWTAGGRFVGLVSQISLIRYDTSSYSGYTLRRVVRTHVGGTSWLVRSGAGWPMFSVSVSSSGTPGESNAWVEGSYNAAINSPNTSATTTLSLGDGLTLSNYLWIAEYIDKYEPPTSLLTQSSERGSFMLYV